MQGSTSLFALMLLAASGILTALAVAYVAWPSFSTKALVLIVLWVAAPLPVAAWVGSRIISSRGAWVLIFGLAIAAAVAGWMYWDAFLGPTSRTESLAGLIVLPMPAIQSAWLALVLGFAWWLASRRSKRMS